MCEPREDSTDSLTLPAGTTPRESETACRILSAITARLTAGEARAFLPTVQECIDAHAPLADVLAILKSQGPGPDPSGALRDACRLALEAGLLRPRPRPRRRRAPAGVSSLSLTRSGRRQKRTWEGQSRRRSTLPCYSSTPRCEKWERKAKGRRRGEATGDEGG